MEDELGQRRQEGLLALNMTISSSLENGPTLLFMRRVTLADEIKKGRLGVGYPP